MNYAKCSTLILSLGIAASLIARHVSPDTYAAEAILLASIILAAIEVLSVPFVNR